MCASMYCIVGLVFSATYCCIVWGDPHLLTYDGARLDFQVTVIFSRQASLTRQAFLITPLHGTRYKTGKNAYAKK